MWGVFLTVVRYFDLFLETGLSGFSEGGLSPKRVAASIHELREVAFSEAHTMITSAFSLFFRSAVQLLILPRNRVFQRFYVHEYGGHR